MNDGWVATSGDYERYFIHEGRRYHHILDPRTGYPANGLQQVTLVGKDLNRLNGYSSTIMVLGLEKGRELLSQLGVDGLIVTASGNVSIFPPVGHFKLLD